MGGGMDWEHLWWPTPAETHQCVCAGLSGLLPIEALEEAHSQFISSFLSQIDM